MAITPLSAFQLLNSATVVALGVPKAFPIPSAASPTTLLITNLGPEAAYVSLTTAAATTTATQATVGSYTIVVASNAGIVVGQNVLGVGIADGVAIPAGYLQYVNAVQTTTVLAISGTTITLSNPTTAALSGTTVNFVACLPLGTGLPVLSNVAAVPLVIGSNTFVQAICSNPQSRSILSLSVGV